MAKHKLLLVDDEVDITSILKIGLEKEGFEVDAFNKPEKALSQFKPNYYDAIILDVRMPGMNGFELAKAIWSRDEKARICFFSTFEISEYEATVVFPGLKSHCFIKKPMPIMALTKHIRGHLLTC